MWAYILRRILYNVPVYLGIIFFLMAGLRVNDPIWGYLGKNASDEAYAAMEKSMGLDEPFLVQYWKFTTGLVSFEKVEEVIVEGEAPVASWVWKAGLEESWSDKGRPVGDLVADAVGPSLSITVPALVLTSLLSITIAILSAYYRGRWPDKLMMVSAVLGMSVSFLVYIIFGQYWGAYVLNEELGSEFFAIQGYKPSDPNWWVTYCMLPVLISTIVAMGYDTRFYRAVMVEETNRDYITTARAKGASKRKIMFVHMLKNAMIPIITRIMITLPFLLMGSLLLEVYFGIPGMGRALLQSITTLDFPVAQLLVALFAGIFLLTVILTDVFYALVDPRVRLQ